MKGSQLMRRRRLMKHLFIRHRVPVGDCGRRSRSILLTSAWIWVLSLGALCAAYGQATGQNLPDANLGDVEHRQETLDWLDKYLTDSDLMLPGAAAKIRAAVAQMSPSQVERWSVQTKQLREYVESPQWQVTKRWLHGFLKVQAIYSDKELQDFRQKLFDADADQLLAMLQQIQAKHESMVWMHQASGKTRQMDVQGRNTAVARQDAANNAARATAPREMPLFGNAGGAGSSRKPDSGYRVPGPLVDSRSVAAWEVWRSAW
jgi:hypothetical protein